MINTWDTHSPPKNINFIKFNFSTVKLVVIILHFLDYYFVQNTYTTNLISEEVDFTLFNKNWFNLVSTYKLLVITYYFKYDLCFVHKL